MASVKVLNQGIGKGDAADDNYVLESKDDEQTPLYYDAGHFLLAKGFLYERFLSGLKYKPVKGNRYQVGVTLTNIFFHQVICSLQRTQRMVPRGHNKLSFAF